MCEVSAASIWADATKPPKAMLLRIEPVLLIFTQSKLLRWEPVPVPLQLVPGSLSTFSVKTALKTYGKFPKPSWAHVQDIKYKYSFQIQTQKCSNILFKQCNI